MKRLCLIFLSLAALAGAQESTTVPELFNTRQQHDGKQVTLGGTIKGYSEKPDQTIFLLTDSGKIVSVFLPRKAGYSNGEKAIVTGTFFVEKKLGNQVMTNVVEATSIEPSQE